MNENFKQCQLATIDCQNAMVDLLQKYCEKGLNCLCLLKTVSKESLGQELLLKKAGVNLDMPFTMENSESLVQAMHEICSWGLYIDKFQSIMETNNKIKELSPDYVFIELENNNIIQRHLKRIAKEQQVVIVLIHICNGISNKVSKGE